jgi:hypothetical protein
MSLDLKNYEPALKAGAQIGALALGDFIPEASLRISSLDIGPINAVTLEAIGDDANVALAVSVKGDGSFVIVDENRANLAEFTRSSSSDINYLRFSGAATGLGPTIHAISEDGGDADVNLVLTNQGEGSLQLDNGTRTATATAGAATLAKTSGVITTEALTTAAGATYTLTLTNSKIAAADQVYVSVANGTNTAGMPVVCTVTPAANSVVIVLQNIHSADALNGTLKISFALLK